MVNLTRQDYRGFQRQVKPKLKVIRRQLRTDTDGRLHYAKFSSALRRGDLDKAEELLDLWLDKKTEDLADEIFEEYHDLVLQALQKQKDQRNIDLAMAKMGQAEDAIKAREKAQDDIENFKPDMLIKTIPHTLISDIQYLASQTHHGKEHVARWSRALAALGVNNGFTPLTLSEAEANTKKYSSPLWEQLVKVLKIKAKGKTVQETVNSAGKGLEKLEASVDKYHKAKEQSIKDQEPSKIVIEAVQEVKALQQAKLEANQIIIDKEVDEEIADKEEIAEIPKSQWANIFNDLMLKWADKEPAVMREFHDFYKKTLDEHYLTYEDTEALVSSITYAKENLKDVGEEQRPQQQEYIDDLETVNKIYHQKIESQPNEPPADPYEHLQGRRRWSKMLWDIQKTVGNPDSKTISNLRSDLLKVWNLQTSDYVIKNIQREDILEKVIAIVNEKIQADSGIESLAASNQLQRKIARECFVEQFGGDTYVGNGYPREDCSPKWLIEDFEKLRVWCVAKGGSYWSSIRTNIYNSLNGQSVRDVPFDSVPYGTMRMVNPHKTSYYGIVSSEYIPDKEQIRKLLAWRRNQISLYLNGLIKREEINWRMPE